MTHTARSQKYPEPLQCRNLFGYGSIFIGVLCAATLWAGPGLRLEARDDNISFSGARAEAFWEHQVREDAAQMRGSVDYVSSHADSLGGVPPTNPQRIGFHLAYAHRLGWAFYYGLEVGLDDLKNHRGSASAKLDLAWVPLQGFLPHTTLLGRGLTGRETSTPYSEDRETRRSSLSGGLGHKTELWRAEALLEKVWWNAGQGDAPATLPVLNAPSFEGWNAHGWILRQLPGGLGIGSSLSYKDRSEDLRQVTSVGAGLASWNYYPIASPQEELALSALLQWTWRRPSGFQPLHLALTIPLYSTAVLPSETVTSTGEGSGGGRGRSTSALSNTVDNIAPFEATAKIAIPPWLPMLDARLDLGLLIVPYPGGSYFTDDQWRELRLGIEFKHRTANP